MKGPEENTLIARVLEDVAQTLHEQHANPFRIQAYQHAAATLRNLERPVREIFRAEGEQGLQKLSAVGKSLARSISTLLLTGRLPMLDRLRGELDPEVLLQTVPGIGPVLAERFHHEVGIHSLEELEAAAQAGQLDAMPGIGEKRRLGILDSLAARLRRVQPPRDLTRASPPPLVELLDVDREYREQALAGTLPRIAPRRFNPKKETWLPILHTHRGKRDYTALFSNTARAHQLRKIRDWVVLYSDGEGNEHQYTVITSQWGPLSGHRIVRGREAECLRFYERQTKSSSPAPSSTSEPTPFA